MSAPGINLKRVLSPSSVAIVGASPRVGTVGHEAALTVRDTSFSGAIYYVNPRYEVIEGQRCYPSLAALPEVPDAVLMAIGNDRLEGMLDAAIALAVGGVVILGSCYVENESSPTLVERLRRKAVAAGMPVVGGNGMGLYNFDAHCYLSMVAPTNKKSGGIALIAHSGSVFSALTLAGSRYRLNLAVSPGQELCGSLGDYIQFALAMPTTKVIAIFMEAVREPAVFIAALKSALQRRVPVVVMKVGRSETAAKAAASHTGALVGSDNAFQAICDRYGVIRVESLDELIATAMLFEQRAVLGQGGLASILDSGGLREILLDEADEVGVAFAQINPATVKNLTSFLPAGLLPMNPLDAAGAMDDTFVDTFSRGIDALLNDPDTAICACEFFTSDEAASSYFTNELLNLCTQKRLSSEKTIVVVNSYATAPTSMIAAKLRDQGVAMFNGVKTFLRAVKHAFAYRDFVTREQSAQPAAMAKEVVQRWRERLDQGTALSEFEALAVLNAAGIATATAEVVGDLRSALAAANKIGFPVVLKTAKPGIQHKSDVGGVKLNVTSIEQVIAAYNDLAERLHPRVIVERAVRSGPEIAFGMVRDAQFGAMVMVSAGGTLVELANDRAVAAAPFDENEARRLLGSLRIARMLHGYRGQAAVDIDSLAAALARFSVLVYSLGDSLVEFDVNPIIASAEGSVAVDALVISAASSGATHPTADETRDRSLSLHMAQS